MPDPNGASPLKRESARLTEGDDRAPARSMLRAIGFSRADLAKPLIGVGHSWIETMPCNYNHRRLTEKVKAGVRAAGGTPMEFNTIAVSDGVSMGTEGMKASLVSREAIADSIELVARGHLFDGLVMIVGCDKTIPAAVMALVRLNLGVGPLQRHHRSRALSRPRHHPAGCLRGGWGGGGRHHDEGGARRDRGGRLSRRGRVWWAVHGQHDGNRHRVPRDQPGGGE